MFWERRGGGGGLRGRLHGRVRRGRAARRTHGLVEEVREAPAAKRDVRIVRIVDAACDDGGDNPGRLTVLVLDVRVVLVLDVRVVQHSFPQQRLLVVRLDIVRPEGGRRHEGIADGGVLGSAGRANVFAVLFLPGLDDKGPGRRGHYTVQARVGDRRHALRRLAVQDVQEGGRAAGGAVRLGQPTGEDGAGRGNQVAPLSGLVVIVCVVLEVRQPQRRKDGRLQAQEPRAAGRKEERHHGVDGRDLGGQFAREEVGD